MTSYTMHTPSWYWYWLFIQSLIFLILLTGACLLPVYHFWKDTIASLLDRDSKNKSPDSETSDYRAPHLRNVQSSTTIADDKDEQETNPTVSKITKLLVVIVLICGWFFILLLLIESIVGLFHTHENKSHSCLGLTSIRFLLLSIVKALVYIIFIQRTILNYTNSKYASNYYIERISYCVVGILSVINLFLYWALVASSYEVVSTSWHGYICTINYTAPSVILSTVIILILDLACGVVPLVMLNSRSVQIIKNRHKTMAQIAMDLSSKEERTRGYTFTYTLRVNPGNEASHIARRITTSLYPPNAEHNVLRLSQVIAADSTVPMVPSADGGTTSKEAPDATPKHEHAATESNITEFGDKIIDANIIVSQPTPLDDITDTDTEVNEAGATSNDTCKDTLSSAMKDHDTTAAVLHNKKSLSLGIPIQPSIQPNKSQTDTHTVRFSPSPPLPTSDQANPNLSPRDLPPEKTKLGVTDSGKDKSEIPSPEEDSTRENQRLFVSLKLLILLYVSALILLCGWVGIVLLWDIIHSWILFLLIVSVECSFKFGENIYWKLCCGRYCSQCCFPMLKTIALTDEFWATFCGTFCYGCGGCCEWCGLCSVCANRTRVCCITDDSKRREHNLIYDLAKDEFDMYCKRVEMEFSGDALEYHF